MKLKKSNLLVDSIFTSNHRANRREKSRQRQTTKGQNANENSATGSCGWFLRIKSFATTAAFAIKPYLNIGQIALYLYSRSPS